MPPLLHILYKILMHGNPQILWLQSMHTFKIFQKLNHRNMFNLKKYNIPLELASVSPFFHTNTYQFWNLCHFKAMFKTMYLKNKHEDTLFLCCILYFVSWLCMQEIRKYLNHNFNYTHTSFIEQDWLNQFYILIKESRIMISRVKFQVHPIYKYGAGLQGA